MEFTLLEEVVRLSTLVAIPSIIASTALLAIIVCRKTFKANGGRKDASDFFDQRSSDIVVLVLFAIAEFSLTGSAVVFGLVKHLVLR